MLALTTALPAKRCASRTASSAVLGGFWKNNATAGRYRDSQRVLYPDLRDEALVELGRDVMIGAPDAMNAASNVGAPFRN